MESYPIGPGYIELPTGWFSDGPNVLVKPVSPRFAIPLSAKATKPTSQMLITAFDKNIEGECLLNEKLEEFLEKLAKDARQMRRLSQGPFSFKYDDDGIFVLIQYEVAPGMTSVQQHVMRVNHTASGTILSHLTGTCTFHDRLLMDEEITPGLRTYRIEVNDKDVAR